MIGRLQITWSTVGHEHEYISPTWPATVTSEGSGVPAIATPYHRNGNVLEYLHRHCGADRLNIVCQTASALAYIHSKNVIHGNVCPVSLVGHSHLRSRLRPSTDTLSSQENICITDDGTVRLTDIGVNNLVLQTNNSHRYSIPSKWMYKPSEELVSATCTTQTDTYSFATTIYSVCLDLA
jgi:serine/threonine protein kinase